jgi:hypothetical protein
VHEQPTNSDPKINPKDPRLQAEVQDRSTFIYMKEMQVLVREGILSIQQVRNFLIKAVRLRPQRL